MYINNTMASDGKLLIYIAKKLHLTVSNCLDALLNYEKHNRMIRILPSDFGSKIDIFENEVLPRMAIAPDVVDIIKELNSIANEHENSPVEFSRGDKFVICSDGYHTIKALDVEMLKHYIDAVRNFLYLVNGAIGNVWR